MDAADAGAADQRRLGHLLYLELSAFTSAYLAHQVVEERVVMPALEQALGFEAVARHPRRRSCRRSRPTRWAAAWRSCCRR